MARSSAIFVISLVLSLFWLQVVAAQDLVDQVNTSDVKTETPQKVDCGVACKARCELSSRPNLCNRACGTCCSRCNCVPPGTSGNQDVCPCYYTMTTRGGKRKCP